MQHQKKQHVYKKNNKLITVILYEGIESKSVQQEVLLPLLAQLEASKNLEVTLMTFERKPPKPQALMELIPAHDRFHFVMGRRLPFLGRLSLRPALWQLQRMLLAIPGHEVIARGPLAGYLALEAISALAKKRPELMRKEHTQSLPKVTVQARGLAAEDLLVTSRYSSSYSIKSIFAKHLHKELRHIEWVVYRNKRKSDLPNDVHIEAVTPALKDHLVENFRGDPAKITVGHKDIPKSPTGQQITHWKEEMRKKMLIPADAEVYAFSGSAKPWECAPETIYYFLQQHKKNPKSFLLVLTPDVEYFATLLSRSEVPVSAYLLRKVAPQEVYKFLAAADRGLLFAHREVTSWVSRPAAMLQYQAVGLPIVHNETIAWLAQK